MNEGEETPPEDAVFVDTDEEWSEEESSEDFVPEEVRTAVESNEGSRQDYLQLLAALREIQSQGYKNEEKRIEKAWNDYRKQYKLRKEDWLALANDLSNHDEVLAEGCLEYPLLEQLWLIRIANKAQEGNHEKADQLLEEALSLCGRCGPRLWEAARALQADFSTEDNSRRNDTQKELWRRQLRTPLQESEKTLAQYEECFGIDPEVRRWHAGAAKIQAQRNENGEFAVASAAMRKDLPALTEAWIDYAEKYSSSDRGWAKLILERALLDLEGKKKDTSEFIDQIWHTYLRLDSQNIVTARRALDACREDAYFHVHYIRCLEGSGMLRFDELFDFVNSFVNKTKIKKNSTVPLAAAAAVMRSASGSDTEKDAFFERLCQALSNKSSDLVLRLRIYQAANTTDTKKRRAMWQALLSLKSTQEHTECWAACAAAAVGDFDAARAFFRANARKAHIARDLTRFKQSAQQWFDAEHDLLRAPLNIVRETEAIINKWCLDIEKAHVVANKKRDTENHLSIEPTTKKQQTEKEEAPVVVTIAEQDIVPTQEAIKKKKRKRKPQSEEAIANAERIHRTIYIANLDQNIHESQLLEFWTHHAGPVRLARLLLDKETGASRCAAFIEFDKVETIDIALAVQDLAPLSPAPDNLCRVAKSQFAAPQPFFQKESSKGKAKNLNPLAFQPRTTLLATTRRQKKMKLHTSSLSTDRHGENAREEHLQSNIQQDYPTDQSPGSETINKTQENAAAAGRSINSGLSNNAFRALFDQSFASSQKQGD